MTASISELVTTSASRGAIRGLGDRIRLERQRIRSSGGGRGGREVQWVTVYVGVGRYDREAVRYILVEKPRKLGFDGTPLFGTWTQGHETRGTSGGSIHPPMIAWWFNPLTV